MVNVLQLYSIHLVLGWSSILTLLSGPDPPGGKYAALGGKVAGLCAALDPLLPPRNREGPSCGCSIWTGNSVSSNLTSLLQNSMIVSEEF